MLMTLFEQYPDLDWTDHIQRYLKHPYFKPETLEFLLNNGFPTAFLVFGRHGEARVLPRTLMDASIQGRNPELCDVCYKFGIPPSLYSMEKWKTHMFPLSISKHLEREQSSRPSKSSWPYA